MHEHSHSYSSLFFSTSDSSEEGEKREPYNEALYDPTLLSLGSLDIGEVVYEPEDDRKKLEFHRMQVLRTGQMSADAEDELVTRAREGMNDEEEAQFSVQVSSGGRHGVGEVELGVSRGVLALVTSNVYNEIYFHSFSGKKKLIKSCIG